MGSWHNFQLVITRHKSKAFTCHNCKNDQNLWSQDSGKYFHIVFAARNTSLSARLCRRSTTLRTTWWPARPSSRRSARTRPLATPPTPSAASGQGRCATCRRPRWRSSHLRQGARRSLSSSVDQQVTSSETWLLCISIFQGAEFALVPKNAEPRCARSRARSPRSSARWSRRGSASTSPSSSLPWRPTRAALTCPRRCAPGRAPTRGRWRSRWWRSGAMRPPLSPDLSPRWSRAARLSLQGSARPRAGGTSQTMFAIQSAMFRSAPPATLPHLRLAQTPVWETLRTTCAVLNVTSQNALPVHHHHHLLALPPARGISGTTSAALSATFLSVPHATHPLHLRRQLLHHQRALQPASETSRTTCAAHSATFLNALPACHLHHLHNNHPPARPPAWGTSGTRCASRSATCQSALHALPLLPHHHHLQRAPPRARGTSRTRCASQSATCPSAHRAPHLWSHLVAICHLQPPTTSQGEGNGLAAQTLELRPTECRVLLEAGTSLPESRRTRVWAARRGLQAGDRRPTRRRSRRSRRTGTRSLPPAWSRTGRGAGWGPAPSLRNNSDFELALYLTITHFSVLTLSARTMTDWWEEGKFSCFPQKSVFWSTIPLPCFY